jgi:hypothetical protein
MTGEIPAAVFSIWITLNGEGTRIKGTTSARKREMSKKNRLSLKKVSLFKNAQYTPYNSVRQQPLFSR